MNIQLGAPAHAPDLTKTGDADPGGSDTSAPNPSLPPGLDTPPGAGEPPTQTPSEPPAESTPQGEPPAETTPPSEPASNPPTGTTPAATGDPFAGVHLYVEPNSPAAQTQHEWASAGRSAEAAQLGKIASQPVAKWFGNWSYGHGGTAGDVNWWVSAATAAGALPVLVAYDIPWRDCSQYSSGGAASPQAYEQFIEAMVQGIAGRRAVVLLEPDALAELECLPAEKQASYYALLSYSVAHLAKSSAVSVYLDAGNAHWQSAATIAARLRKADVAGARGFSLNVSNFDTSASEASYGQAIDTALGSSAHFVLDTSRNGQGPAAGGAWCNPPGRGLGADPSANTGNSLIDAYLWIKTPGASDGTCNGGPAAGQWWPEYALGLAERAAG